MRLALALAVVFSVGCHAVHYDPVDEIEFQAFPDERSALAAVLMEAGPAKVYAVGEYHPTSRTANVKSPLAHFASMVDVIAPRAHHIVLESWLDDGCSAAKQVDAQIAATIDRPTTGAKTMDAFIMKGEKQKLVAHGLTVTCLEQSTILDQRGRVDFLALLQLITEKLGDEAASLASSDDRAVIVYGGALHNDLYPRWQLDSLSYAVDLDKKLGGGVVEIDLVVPEIIAPMSMVRAEGWFPLIGRSAPDVAMVWKRGPHSFVIILPAQSTAVARIALPMEHA
ncbi:MAG TPA: hypothetical protein VGM39_02480 [Kofleriaceae bacterium]|jgi:hypothetical protein